MERIFKTVLLLALPASGKSEVRKFLAWLGREVLRRDFHLGPMVELDDYPYVAWMRRLDDEFFRVAGVRLFFQNTDRPFVDPRSWGALIRLLNQDHRVLVQSTTGISSASLYLWHRLNEAHVQAGLSNLGCVFTSAARDAVCEALEAEARKTVTQLMAAHTDTLADKTLMVEFARGGLEGARMPLPYAYEYSLGLLDPEILKDAVVLYIGVSPEESMRRNLARARPDGLGSTLFHGVPEAVMHEDYGCDDIGHLLTASDRPGFIRVKHESGWVFYLPAVVFENEDDKTSFVRDVPQEEWDPRAVSALRTGLQKACGRLWTTLNSR